LTKEEFATILMDGLKVVFGQQEWPHDQQRARRPNAMLKLCVVDEVHQTNGQIHKQFALLADKPWIAGPFKKWLRKTHNIAAHFSIEHEYYWTSFLYLTVPSDKKPLADLDPDPWLSQGHPPVDEQLLDMPPGARRPDKLRVRAFLGLDARGRPMHGAANTGELGPEEFSALVTELGLRTRRQLLAWIMKHRAAPVPELKALPPATLSWITAHNGGATGGGDDAETQAARTEGMQAQKLNSFVHKHLRDLNDRIHLAWELHDALGEEERADLSAWELVCRAPEKMPCVCDGRWAGLTDDMLEKHVASGVLKNVDPVELPHVETVRAALRTALKDGCGKHRNVFIVGPANAAKTHLLAPLVSIFGKESFRRPLGKTNYPMMDIHGKKVCVLEDLRAATFGLGWDAYLVWWEGLPLPVPMPQNHHRGPKDYVDRAPVFATGGERLRIPLREALDLGVDPSVQNDMMNKRWVYFTFTQRFDGSERQSVKPCGHCFAKWVQDGELAVVDFF